MSRESFIEDELLTEREVASIVGVTARTVRQWRYEGTGPRHFRVNARLVRYSRFELEQWLAGLREAQACIPEGVSTDIRDGGEGTEGFGGGSSTEKG